MALNPPSLDISVLDAEILFDLSGTKPSITITNKSEGAGLANVSWWFVATTPSGSPIHTGYESTPDVTGAWSTHIIGDDWGRVGWSGAPFTVIIYAKDAAGNVYSKEFNAVICKPSGNKTGWYGMADTDVKVKCDQGSVLFSNQTNSAYKGQPGQLISSILRMIYPVDDTDTVPEPFVSNNFSTLMVPVSYGSDNYQFVASQVYEYDLGNGSKARIKYTQRATFAVYCNINLFPLICEYGKLVDSVEYGGCGSKDIGEKNKKIQIINSKLAMIFIGMMQPLTGVDVPKLIKEIEEIGEFDCNCCKSDTSGIQSSTASQIDGYNFTVTNQGGDIVGSFAASSGKNIILQLQDRIYTFSIGQSTLDNTTAFSWTPSASGFVKEFKLNVDLAVLATDLATAIQDNPSIYNIWKNLFGVGEATKIVVDGGCIFSTGSVCDYTFTLENIPASGSYAILAGIRSLGVFRNVNHSFNLASLSGLQTYLNSLNIGVFTVASLGGGVVEISSEDNPNSVDDIVYKVSSNLRPAVIEKSCTGYTETSLDEFAANIINYLCNLNDIQVKTSQQYEVKWIDSNGVVHTVIVDEGNSLASLLNEIINGYGNTVDYVKSLGAVNCNNIRRVFSSTSGTLQPSDVVLGTRSGECGQIPIVDLFNKAMESGINDLATLNNFCAMVQKCGAGLICQPFSYRDVVVTAYSTTCAEPIGIEYSIS